MYSPAAGLAGLPVTTQHLYWLSCYQAPQSGGLGKLNWCCGVVLVVPRPGQETVIVVPGGTDCRVSLSTAVARPGSPAPHQAANLIPLASEDTQHFTTSPLLT